MLVIHGILSFDYPYLEIAETSKFRTMKKITIVSEAT
jgi:hypothetical protein